MIGTKPKVRLTFVNLALVTNEVKIVREPLPSGPSYAPKGNVEKVKLEYTCCSDFYVGF